MLAELFLQVQRPKSAAAISRPLVVSCYVLLFFIYLTCFSQGKGGRNDPHDIGY
jgi:hypothetical protein